MVIVNVSSIITPDPSRFYLIFSCAMFCTCPHCYVQIYTPI
jgi:hypothetical protein